MAIESIESVRPISGGIAEKKQEQNAKAKLSGLFQNVIRGEEKISTAIKARLLSRATPVVTDTQLSTKTDTKTETEKIKTITTPRPPEKPSQKPEQKKGTEPEKPKKEGKFKKFVKSKVGRIALSILGLVGLGTAGIEAYEAYQPDMLPVKPIHQTIEIKAPQETVDAKLLNIPANFIVKNNVQKETINIEAGINAVPATPEDISAIIDKGIPLLPKEANSVNSPKMPLIFPLKLKAGEDVEFRVDRPMISEKGGPTIGMGAGTFTFTILKGEPEIIMPIPTTSAVKAYRTERTISSGTDAGKHILNGVCLDFYEKETHYIVLMSLTNPDSLEIINKVHNAPTVDEVNLSNAGNGVVVGPTESIMKINANTIKNSNYFPSLEIFIFAIDANGNRTFIEGDLQTNTSNQLLYSPTN